MQETQTQKALKNTDKTMVNNADKLADKNAVLKRGISNALSSTLYDALSRTLYSALNGEAKMTAAADPVPSRAPRPHRGDLLTTNHSIKGEIEGSDKPFSPNKQTPGWSATQDGCHAHQFTQDPKQEPRSRQ